MNSLSALALGAISLAWLVPNHYFPWASAWPDGFAILMLASVMLGKRGRLQLPPAWLTFCGLSLITLLLQALSGQIMFAGDAWVAALYLLCLASAITLGTSLARTSTSTIGHCQLSPWIVGMVAAATVSVGIALVQWSGALSLGIWVVDLAQDTRPYGNVAQPNHLATLCFLGLCGLGWLQQRKLVGRWPFALASAWLLLGLVITWSRTGWLEAALLVVLGVTMGRRTKLLLRPWSFAALGVLCLALVLCWPPFNELLGLSPGRTATEMAQAGTRRAHWGTLWQALRAQPWWGYGWQQVSVAQLQAAHARPFVGEYIEHSHNIVLDLMIWTGIPVGLLLTGLAIGWYLMRLAHCRRGDTWWLLIAIGGLLIHGMLEYPLEFAYFLIPFGLLIGAVHGADQPADTPRRSTWQVPVLGGGLLLGLSVVGADYLQAEQSFRLLRLESARIGAVGISTTPPKLAVLTQLEAFQQFAHTEAQPNMEPAQLEWMHRVAARYAYPPALFRDALASGLNGQQQRARVTLLNLCRIHPAERCAEAREAWADVRRQYPVLPAFPET